MDPNLHLLVFLSGCFQLIAILYLVNRFLPTPRVDAEVYRIGVSFMIVALMILLTGIYIYFFT